MVDTPASRRPVRSFVVRGGRLTPAQQEAIESLWSSYGVESTNGIIDRYALFGRQAELVFEIGFGMGDSLIAMARQHPERDNIGIDVHPPGIGNILKEIKTHELENIKVMQGDAMEILDTCFADKDLDRIQIFFPDPWHKKRHHKRRMIQPPFVSALARKMRQGAVLHLATDWENYAEQMMEVMSAATEFTNLAGEGEYSGQKPNLKDAGFGLAMVCGI